MTKGSKTVRFTCEKCSARYSIADEKVKGRSVVVRCVKCDNRIVVNGEKESTFSPFSPFSNDETTQKEKAQLSDGWYAIVERQQVGPLPGSEFQALIEQGKVKTRSFVWREGQGEWKRAGEIAVLQPFLSPPVSSPPSAADAEPFAQAAGSDAGSGSDNGAASPIIEKSAETKVDQISDSKIESVAALEPKPEKEVSLGKLLFDDARPEENSDALPREAEQTGDLAASLAAGQERQTDEKDKKPFDPFEQVPDRLDSGKSSGEIGEQTRFFMRRAGVTRRNPPWKIALFVVLLFVLPGGVLYLLSRLNVGFLQITTRVDAKTGQEVRASVFSSEGFAGLRDMLLQAKKPEGEIKPKPGPAKPSDVRPVSKSDDDKPLVAKPKIDFNMSPEEKKRIEELYKSPDFAQKGPRALANVETIHLDGKGLDEKVVAEVFGKNLKAFQTCVETEIRRNPSFQGGKIKITFTIGVSGIVTKATVDKPDIDQSTMGACLKEKAKRMVFPSFEGESFDVESPLVLAKGA